MIAHQDGGVVAPAGIGGGPPAPQGGLVHDVVVDEGGRVEQLDHAAHSHGPGSRIARHAGGHEEQDGAEALASGPRDEVAHLANEGHGRVELARDGLLDGAHLGANGKDDALFEERLEVGRGGHGSGGASVSGRRRGP